ncbi:hypothetical protein ABPG75_003843 [Micractinium tetrahymenae]
MDGQFLRLVQHTLRHAAYRLGGGSLAGSGVALGSSAAGGAALLGTGAGQGCSTGVAPAGAAGLLRLLHSWASPAPAAATSSFTAPAAAPQARPLSTGTAAAADGPGRGRRVAVGVSGGVDSALAAMLLQRQGYDVVGVFMRNWDESEETGNQNCSVERDLRDATAVCRQLGILLHEADFVSAYWNQVFSEFIAQCGRGLTPNPDLACNRHIKFDALLRFAAELGADTVATGHYARIQPGPGGGPPQLLRGADHGKDQTYFLASVQPAALRHVLFPVGHLQKPEVRRMAAEAGLVPADKRSSAGICFIGRRNFADFLSQYIPPLPGRFVDVETGGELGPCPDIAAVTHGQRPGIGGAAERVYAVGKDVVDRVVYVAQGRDHPALLCTAALLRTPHWLSPEHACQLAEAGSLRCQYKARYGQQPRACTLYTVDGGAAAAVAGAAAAAAAATDASAAAVCPASAAAAAEAAGPAAEAAAAAAAASLGFAPSAFCRLHPEDARTLPSYLVVRFDEPAGAITPQQAFVLYDGERCLGAALIAQPGRSLFEQALAAAPAAEAG